RWGLRPHTPAPTPASLRDAPGGAPSWDVSLLSTSRTFASRCSGRGPKLGRELVVNEPHLHFAMLRAGPQVGTSKLALLASDARPGHAAQRFEDWYPPLRRLRQARDRASAARRRIEEALAAEGGNQTRAAQRLNMPRRTLVYKLARYRRGE